ncbi:MAG: glycosyltransferase family 2 protein, partial [Chthoniobacterales bacterium]
ESASRGLEDTREKRERFLREVEFMRQKWGARLEADPAYNPNLSLAKDSEFKLAFPPRIVKPWRQS